MIVPNDSNNNRGIVGMNKYYCGMKCYISAIRYGENRLSLPVLTRLL